MVETTQPTGFQSLTEKVFPKMLELGIPSYESKSYLALLIEPGIQASRICEITGIPDSKIYGVLDNAARMNMVEVQHGVPKLYRATSPASLLSNVKEGLKERFAAGMIMSDELEARLHEIYTKRNKTTRAGEGLEIAYVVNGEGNIVSKMKEMIFVARKQITLILPRKKLFGALRESLLEAKVRGVEIRLAVPEGVHNEFEEKGEGELFAFRVLTEECCDTWLLVADGRLLNVSDATSDSSVSAILTKDRVLVQMAEAYFDSPLCCVG